MWAIGPSASRRASGTNAMQARTKHGRRNTTNSEIKSPQETESCIFTEQAAGASIARALSLFLWLVCVLQPVDLRYSRNSPIRSDTNVQLHVDFEKRDKSVERRQKYKREQRRQSALRITQWCRKTRPTGASHSLAAQITSGWISTPARPWKSEKSETMRASRSEGRRG